MSKPALELKKPHYSATQINMMIRCPAQYRFRYIEGYIEPPKSSRVEGRAYHKGLEHNYSQKIQSWKDLPVDDVKDAFVTTFDEEIRGVEWNKDEVSEGVEKVKGRLKDEGLGLLETYQRDLAPQIQPKEVEVETSIEFDNVPYIIKGYIDLIDDKEIIRDHKTAKQTPSRAKDSDGNPIKNEYILPARDLHQGCLYAISRNAKGISFDYAVKLKTPKIVQVPVRVTETDKQYTLNLLGHIDHAIKKQAFYPNRDSFLCNRRQCGFWEHCEREYGGKVKE